METEEKTEEKTEEQIIFKELDPSCEINILEIPLDELPEPKNKQNTGLKLISHERHEAGSPLQVDFRFPNDTTTYRALVKVARSEPLESGAKFRLSALICDLKKVPDSNADATT